MDSLKIGQLARAAGVKSSAVRYYERRHILSPASRSAAGYRLYDEDALERLWFIKRAQELGFTLKEIVEILRVHEHGAVPCGRVLDLATEKIGRIDDKVCELRRLRDSLSELVEGAKRITRNAAHVCPLIEKPKKNR